GVPGHVAQNQRRRIQPWDSAEGRKVRQQFEVAVSLLPVRHLVAGDGVHLHVQREQVVATLDRLAVAGRLHEVLGIYALAHQATLHVADGDHDGVDDTLLDVGGELDLAYRRLAPW